LWIAYPPVLRSAHASRLSGLRFGLDIGSNAIVPDKHHRIPPPERMYSLDQVVAEIHAKGVVADSPARPHRAGDGHADARAIRRAVLARLTTFERAFLWRWCIGVTLVYAGLFALLAILVLA
jgi:hypothetical protein